tara:strand:+ start:460 stop:582 length:123 start_codon:yes stop_codon:yes gene_type:complete
MATYSKFPPVDCGAINITVLIGLTVIVIEKPLEGKNFGVS